MHAVHASRIQTTFLHHTTQGGVTWVLGTYLLTPRQTQPWCWYSQLHDRSFQRVVETPWAMDNPTIRQLPFHPSGAYWGAISSETHPTCHLTNEALDHWRWAVQVLVVRLGISTWTNCRTGLTNNHFEATQGWRVPKQLCLFQVALWVVTTLYLVVGELR